MTPKEIRNEKMAKRLIDHLGQRHMEAFYCPTKTEAVEKVLELMPDGAVVSWGGSMTLRDMGLTDAIHGSGRFSVIDRDRASSREEAEQMYRQAFSSDVFLSSANAISEDGEIVNIDGNGNRVAAITFGPRKVIFVIGLNKVCGTLDAAITRARTTAAPTNMARFGLSTPCSADGTCHDCKSADTICNFIHILRHSPQNRHTVVLVGEDLGY